MKPIGGGPIFPTRPLSQLVNIILKLFSFLIHIKSYVKGNLGFFRKCTQKSNDLTIFVTFDVKS